MRMCQASPGLWLPEGVTTETMYKGDAMTDQMIEVCGVDSLLLAEAEKRGLMEAVNAT